MDRVGQAGDAKRGKVIWHEAQCAACHRMGGEGGDIGPDLTAVGLRFSRIDLLRSLTEPSAVVSEQYQDTVFSLRNGERVVGRVKAESDGRLTVRVGAVGGQDRVLAVSEVASREPSKVSPMPEGLMDPFTAEEVLDLLAYLQRP
jgi:putative heme-binding domain-containing protein